MQRDFGAGVDASVEQKEQADAEAELSNGAALANGTKEQSKERKEANKEKESKGGKTKALVVVEDGDIRVGDCLVAIGKEVRVSVLLKLEFVTRTWQNAATNTPSRCCEGASFTPNYCLR